MYRKEKRPDWWPQQIAFKKPNELKQQELLEVLKHAPVHAGSIMHNMPSDQKPLLEDLRKCIYEQLKTEPHKGPRYAPENRPFYWPPDVEFKAPTALPKKQLIKIVERMQKMQIKSSHDSPGVPTPYDMNSQVRGICLAIINGVFEDITHFDTKLDIDIIVQTFEQLRFICWPFENLTAKEIRDVVKTVRAEDHSKYNALVVLVASHGFEKCVVGTDGHAVYQREITHAFSTVKCPTLANKPKVFVFDVCRGDKRMSGLITHKSPLAVAPDHAKDKVAPDTSEMPPYSESKQGPVMAICPTSRSGSSTSTASGRGAPKLADMLTANATCPGGNKR